MRSFLLRNTRICDPKHSFHNKLVDIHIKNGTIEQLGNIEGSQLKEIDMEGAWCFPGWIDTLSYCGSPGNEEDETFESLEKTALAGGYTTIATVFGRETSTQNGSDVRGIREAVKNAAIQILPIGNVSQNRLGQELAELHDMHSQGAVAFFDGTSQSTQPALKPVVGDYSQSINAAFYMWPWEANQAPGAIVNQSANTTALGLKGFHTSMEGSQLAADAELFEKHGASVYFPYLTAAESIKTAKGSSMHYFGIPVYNLRYTDEALESFDENFKLWPPLREGKHIQKLIKAIEKGWITAVCSNHLPLNKEIKEREFLYAAFGASALQVVGSELLQALGQDGFMTHAAQLLSHGGAKILGIPENAIKEGEEANLTFFNPKVNWSINSQSNKSLSHNYPCWNKELEGKVTHVVAKGTLHQV